MVLNSGQHLYPLLPRAPCRCPAPPPRRQIALHLPLSFLLPLLLKPSFYASTAIPVAVASASCWVVRPGAGTTAAAACARVDLVHACFVVASTAAAVVVAVVAVLVVVVLVVVLLLWWRLLLLRLGGILFLCGAVCLSHVALGCCRCCCCCCHCRCFGCWARVQLPAQSWLWFSAPLLTHLTGTLSPTLAFPLFLSPLWSHCSPIFHFLPARRIEKAPAANMIATIRGSAVPRVLEWRGSPGGPLWAADQVTDPVLIL